jgi:hypothetical protein
MRKKYKREVRILDGGLSSFFLSYHSQTSVCTVTIQITYSFKHLTHLVSLQQTETITTPPPPHTLVYTPRLYQTSVHLTSIYQTSLSLLPPFLKTHNLNLLFPSNHQNGHLHLRRHLPHRHDLQVSILSPCAHQPQLRRLAAGAR